ncbi:hypothetical protein ACFQVD_09235 [Streptosporangium amethystogenes subsp. fukuiense]|uniref:Uncharacterized protein n=3 Tax=Streptosporangium TaxID=2000 RepID=A0ABW2SVF1_9ACTN
MHGTLAAPAHAELSLDGQQRIDTVLHAATMRLRSPQLFKDVVLSLLHVAEVTRNPAASEEHYTQVIKASETGIGAKLDRAYPGAGHEADALVRIGALAESDPVYREIGVVLNGLVNELPASPQRYDDWRQSLSSQRSADAEAAVVLRGLNEKAAATIRELSAQRGADHPAVRAWNAEIGADSGITASATTDELLQSSPLKDAVDLQAIMKFPPSDPKHKEEIVKQMNQLLAKSNENVKQTVKDIEVLHNGSDGAFLWVTYAPPTPPSAYDLAAERAKTRQESINAAGEGLRLLTSILGLTNPKEAQKMAAVCDGVIKVATAVNEYLPKIAGKGWREAVFSAGTADLAKTVITTVVALLPLFQAGQPSPEEMILKQVGELRQQVAGLHNAMNEQFTRVNKNLNVIYTEMLGKFDEVLKLQQVSVAQLTQIQGQLHGIEQKVDTWSSEIIKSLQNDHLKNVRAALSQHLRYRETHQQPIPTVGEFDSTMNLVHFAGTSQAREAPFVPSRGSYPTHENDPVAALDLYEETGGAIGFLTWYGNRKYGWPAGVPAGVAEIPNAAVWLSMATGYRQLAAENPVYAAQMNPQRTADLVAAGRDIDDAVDALSTPAPTPNPDGSHTNKLYTGLVEDYKNAATDFNAALLPLQKQAVDNKDYKLFGTADQAIATQPAPPDIVPFCTGGSGQGPIINLERPANVTYSGNAIPMARYAFPEGSRPTLGYCHQFALTEDSITSTLSVTMHLRITWPSAPGQPANPPQTLRTWTKTWEVPTVCRKPDSSPEPPSVCNPSQYYLDRWVSGGYRQSFAETATLTEYPEPQQAVRTQVTRFLTERQKGYYDAVVTELTTPGKPLFQANAELSTALRLLQAYTAAGFPTALDDDELLQVLLHGAERLPADTPGETTITTIFRTAQNTYSSCAATPDAACAATLNPFAGQQHAWLTNCLTWYKNQLPVARWSQDPLANTIAAFAYHTADTLRLRYDHHSKNLKQKTYTETLAPVTTAHKLLETYDTMTRPSAR